MGTVAPEKLDADPSVDAKEQVTVPAFEEIRSGVIDSKDVPANEKGAVVALLGSIERAEGLMARILAERASIDRGGRAVREPAGATAAAHVEATGSTEA